MTIATVAEPREQPSADSATDLARALRRHGVAATIREVDVAVPKVGAALLAVAKAEGSELLVMGGYGRSRLSEIVLGGTTRHILRYAHLPVPISH